MEITYSALALSDPCPTARGEHKAFGRKMTHDMEMAGGSVSCKLYLSTSEELKDEGTKATQSNE